MNDTNTTPFISIQDLFCVPGCLDDRDLKVVGHILDFTSIKDVPPKNRNNKEDGPVLEKGGNEDFLWSRV